MQLVRHLLAVLGCLAQLQAPVEHEESEESEGDGDDESGHELHSLEVRHGERGLESKRQIAQSTEDLVPVDGSGVPAAFGRDHSGAAQCKEQAGEEKGRHEEIECERHGCLH